MKPNDNSPLNLCDSSGLLLTKVYLRVRLSRCDLLLLLTFPAARATTFFRASRRRLGRGFAADELDQGHLCRIPVANP
jgi:hypothetical protein